MNESTLELYKTGQTRFEWRLDVYLSDRPELIYLLSNVIAFLGCSSSTEYDYKNLLAKRARDLLFSFLMSYIVLSKKIYFYQLALEYFKNFNADDDNMFSVDEFIILANNIPAYKFTDEIRGWSKAYLRQGHLDRFDTTTFYRDKNEEYSYVYDVYFEARSTDEHTLNKCVDILIRNLEVIKNEIGIEQFCAAFYYSIRKPNASSSKTFSSGSDCFKNLTNQKELSG